MSSITMAIIGPPCGAVKGSAFLSHAGLPGVAAGGSANGLGGGMTAASTVGGLTGATTCGGTATASGAAERRGGSSAGGSILGTAGGTIGRAGAGIGAATWTGASPGLPRSCWYQTPTSAPAPKVAAITKPASVAGRARFRILLSLPIPHRGSAVSLRDAVTGDLDRLPPRGLDDLDLGLGMMSGVPLR
jgi:hypothetical protein